MHYASRNETLGFAERTRKNLEFVEAALAEGEDVHVVTQLVTSLLGLIVFPWERGFAEYARTVNLAGLAEKGWPLWEVRGRSCETLGELIRLLRHAVAHGNVRFSSDSRQVHEVVIEFWNYSPRDRRIDWETSISAPALREFCAKFIHLVENVVG